MRAVLVFLVLLLAAASLVSSAYNATINVSADVSWSIASPQSVFVYTAPYAVNSSFLRLAGIPYVLRLVVNTSLAMPLLMPYPVFILASFNTSSVPPYANASVVDALLTLQRPSFELYCEYPRGNETTVYVVVRNWGWVWNATVQGEGFYAEYSTYPMYIDVNPGYFMLNSTTLVMVFTGVPIAPGQTTIRAYVETYLLSNTTYSEWLECSLVTKIILVVPDTITTYSPNVTITGYVYDYYTGRPLQGIVLDVYLGGERVTSVSTAPDGGFTVYVVLGEPGTYTLRYVWNGVEAGRTIITYLGGGEAAQIAETLTRSIEVAFRRIPVGVPSIAIPRPSLDTPQAIIVAGGLAALWAWAALSVSLSYATTILGFALTVLGVVYGNAAMIVTGAAAMVAGYMIRRSIEK